jgi:small subunit ribosomal protein S8
MSLQDLLSDYVARINNAILANKTEVTVLKNNIVQEVSKKLVSLGFLTSFTSDDRTVLIQLKEKRITKIKRVSKPGHRVYVSSKITPPIVGGKGFNIISTSKGIMTHIESKKENLGGELLFQIY